MASIYWTIREKIRLNPIVSQSIYIAQSALQLFSRSEFSSQVVDAAKRTGAGDGIALCVRIRDEAPDLREFVEYYLAAGIRQIFFYEARSGDNFREVLEPFIAAGHVTLIDDWPHIPISPAAEHDCVLRCIGRYAWLGCIDADEFVVIRDGRTIPEFLSQVSSRIPALALHWRAYGSNGHIKRPDLPVILAYSRRQTEPNFHVKVFVRPERVRFQRNPHSWYYRGLFSAAANEKNKKVWGSTAVPPTAEIAWINHYYHKSLEEFQRKGKRSSIHDRVGIQFNSRTQERGEAYERTANEFVDYSAVNYHRGLCALADCSICKAIAGFPSPSGFEVNAADQCGSHQNLRGIQLQGPSNPPSEFASNSLCKEETTVSVVICTRFRPAVLRSCLRAIAELNQRPDELIVVDNSTGDKGTEELAREFSAIYLIEPEVGLSRARNCGLRASKSQIVAYLDDDALPEKYWLEQIIQPFSDSRVAVVTGAVFVPDLARNSVRRSQQMFLDMTDDRWFEIAAFGGLGIGTNMALRKSACGTPDFFDERLGRGAPFHGMEEHLAFTRLLSRGYGAVHLPGAIVHHASQNPLDLDHEARYHFAYSLLLFSEFPEHRSNLLRFLFQRMRRKPLTWMRNSPDPGEVVSSNWAVLLGASFSGPLLYLRTRKPRK
jgi:glycosyltransferase involved in cell wall biosynthesis